MQHRHNPILPKPTDDHFIRAHDETEPPSRLLTRFKVVELLTLLTVTSLKLTEIRRVEVFGKYLERTGEDAPNVLLFPAKSCRGTHFGRGARLYRFPRRCTTACPTPF